MRKRIPIVLAVLVIAVLGVVMWRGFGAREPVYQGRRLSDWLMAYQPLVNSSTNTGFPAVDMQSAEEAVRAIGTNGIPTLLRLLRKKDSALKLKWVQLLQKQHLVKIRTVSDREWNNTAALAFLALGHEADSALPGLVDIYIKNISPESRRCTLEVIVGLGLPAKGIVPSLVAQTADPDYQVRLDALWALARIRCEPEQVVPVLVKALQDPDFIIRGYAVEGLGSFGPSAKQAVPALLELLKEEKDRNGKEVVAKALRQIDPELANNDEFLKATAPAKIPGTLPIP